MQSTWNQEYYDIIDFYFWEPQHIGKIKSEKSRFHGIDEVLENIKKMEVSLNHQMDIFFRLAPESFLHWMIWKVFQENVEDHYVFHGNKQWRTYVTEKDPTQPDILMSGEKSNIALELKVRAKSSVEQVVKYLLLHYLNERFDGRRKQFYLIYLSPKTFSQLWKPPISDLSSLNERIQKFDFTALRDKTDYLQIDNWGEILDVWQRTRFASITYQDFYDLLVDYRQSLDHQSQYSTTVSKLLDGMIDELLLRGLAT